MKYSLIITAWNEPRTVKKNLEVILNPRSGNLLDDMEIVLVCPDQETYLAAKEVISVYGFRNFRHIKDEKKGKPSALNKGIKASKGKIIITMDGDVVIGKNSIPKLVAFLKDKSIGGVSGRPVPTNTKETMLGFWANLLTEAAHKVRLEEMKKGNSYFMSGYLCCFRKYPDIILPENLLSDDAWITLKILEKNKAIAYSQNSIVYVNFPKNIVDWFKQKRRSAGGYLQLKEFYKNQIKLPRRNFIEELKYIFFPLNYAKNLKQFVYTLALYPIRFILWIIILFDSLSGNYSSNKLWVRIESTK